MKPKLNTLSASLVVLFYIIFSLFSALIARILFGGINPSGSDRIVDSVIGSGMFGNMIVMIALLFISLYIFKDSTKDIFFERKPFNLSKLYYLLPLTWLLVSVFALFNVDFSSYSTGEILLILVAALVIGINEEVLTRGIMLVGLRNSGIAEWKAWMITLVGFALLHLVNILGGVANLSLLLVVITGGAILYVSRRVFNNLFAPIALHALYDTAFFLLTGIYITGETFPDHVLDIQFGSFLVLMLASILFVIFGRGLLKQDTTGW